MRLKGFNKVIFAAVIAAALVFAAANFCVLSALDGDNGRPYVVQVNRICALIASNSADGIDLSDYPLIVDVIAFDAANDGFYTPDCDYLIREVNGTLYRFDYRFSRTDLNGRVLLAVNIAAGIAAAVIFIMLFFIKSKLIKPFNTLKNVPYELSKGNLTVPLTENKSRYFGKFVWGMDMLREKMEQQKQQELKLHKENKTLVLSISHDIKTPLSAIKLYSKALSRNLYDSPEKQHSAAVSISEKCDEIESYVSQIIKASNDDFLSLEVNCGEFYISGIIEKIKAYYSEKLALSGTEFTVGEFGNCLLKGDSDRAVEVLQNLIENAVKYGDGKCISLSFTSEEDCRLITVENSGCTLSESELPHVFESFWRGSNTAGKDGSGLGLYICRKLMQKMDGDIFAESRDGRMRVTAVFRAS